MIKCGSWFACDGVYIANIDVAWPGAIAGKPAPTFNRVRNAVQTITETWQFAVILAALLWSQYEFVANR